MLYESQVEKKFQTDPAKDPIFKNGFFSRMTVFLLDLLIFDPYDYCDSESRRCEQSFFIFTSIPKLLGTKISHITKMSIFSTFLGRRQNKSRNQNLTSDSDSPCPLTLERTPKRALELI